MEISDIQLRSLEQQLENARVLGCEEEFLKAYGVDIEKARSGVYKNTAENKKLSRVGQKYGSAKEESDIQVWRDRLKVGDEVSFPGGRRGRVAELTDNIHVVKIDDGGYLGLRRINRDALYPPKITDWISEKYKATYPSEESKESKGLSDYRKHLISSDNKDLSEYAKTATVQQLKKRWLNDSDFRIIQSKKSSVEHEHNLKEGEQVRTARGKLQRVVEIVGNSVRLSGQNDTVHITKLFRSNGEAVISNKKKDQSKPTIHIGDMSEEQMYEQAKKLGISGHESMSSKELAKKLTDANIDKQLAEFKSQKK